MGSRAIALSPNGRHVYVASSNSDAIAIFARDPKTGDAEPGHRQRRLHRRQRRPGGCAKAIGLDEPNSVAVSPDGHNVYATSRAGNSIAELRPQPENRGAAAAAAAALGLHLRDPAAGSAPAAWRWSPPTWSWSAPTATTSTSAPSSATRSPPSARNPTTRGADAAGRQRRLHRRGDRRLRHRHRAEIGRGPGDQRRRRQCLRGHGALQRGGDAGPRRRHRRPHPGQRRQRLHRRQRRSPAAPSGDELSGANAVAVSPNGANVYVTSLFSNSVTSFGRTTSTGVLTQKEGTAGCLIYLRSAGCSFGRAMVAPEGLALSPDGAQRLRRRLQDRRDRRPRPRQGRRGARRSPVPPVAWRRARCPAARRPGRCRASARSRSAPTAAISTRPRSKATRSTSSGGTDERVGRAPGRADPQTAARQRGQRRRRGAAGPGRRGRAGARRRQRRHAATSPG